LPASFPIQDGLEQEDGFSQLQLYNMLRKPGTAEIKWDTSDELVNLAGDKKDHVKKDRSFNLLC
jgi:hypothetical protein